MLVAIYQSTALSEGRFIMESVNLLDGLLDRLVFQIHFSINEGPALKRVDLVIASTKNKFKAGNVALVRLLMHVPKNFLIIRPSLTKAG